MCFWCCYTRCTILPSTIQISTSKVLAISVTYMYSTCSVLQIIWFRRYNRKACYNMCVGEVSIRFIRQLPFNTKRWTVEVLFMKWMSESSGSVGVHVVILHLGLTAGIHIGWFEVDWIHCDISIRGLRNTFIETPSVAFSIRKKREIAFGARAYKKRFWREFNKLNMEASFHIWHPAQAWRSPFVPSECF